MRAEATAVLVDVEPSDAVLGGQAGQRALGRGRQRRRVRTEAANAAVVHLEPSSQVRPMSQAALEADAMTTALLEPEDGSSQARRRCRRRAGAWLRDLGYWRPGIR
jgi:hypothetical protein